LYALISGLEEDLRELIDLHLSAAGTPAVVLGDDIYQGALARSNEDPSGSTRTDDLSNLLPYLDFTETFQVLNHNRARLPTELASWLRNRTINFERIGQIRNRVMHFRPLELTDLPTVESACDDVLKSQHGQWSHLIDVTDRIKREPAYVLGLEIPVETRVEKHNLPLPDFDDTGFIGRDTLVTDLANYLIRGAYPVVTISGVGGLGKTALALKVAYDIVDRPDNPFERIVWSTAKSSVLGPREIRKIEDAIADSLSMLNDIAEEVIGKGLDIDPFEEIITYLSEFKILLILDNLETVLDPRLKDFLRRLPVGSRVLLTSRVSVGQLDYPIALSPLQPGEAVELIRAVAKVRDSQDLTRLPNDRLALYCKRMQYSPGWIKWFVTAAQAGVRPEEALSRPDLFLEFCLENVYRYLSDTARRIGRSFLSVPGKHSQSMLAFINSMDTDDGIVKLQAALNELINANMVTISSIPQGVTYQTQYELADLPREYLTRHFPPKREEQQKYAERVAELSKLGERLTASQRSDPYALTSIRIQSRSDLVIARALTDAINSIAERDWAAAGATLGRARMLSPEYFEVHRVGALLEEARGDVAAARTAYEDAIDHEPNWAALHLQFAAFLLREYRGTREWAAQLEKAIELEPKSTELRLEIAKVLTRSGEFEAAAKAVSPLLDKANELPKGHVLAAFDYALDAWVRAATDAAKRKDADAIYNRILEAKATFQLCPADIRNEEMRKKLRHACYAAVELSMERPKTPEEALRLADWFSKEAGSVIPRGTREVGDITRTGNRGFGYVTRRDGSELYFHQGDMATPSDFTLLRNGVMVSYAIAIGGGRRHAVDLRLVPG
jgi:Flp pilus assembly protein TadD/cold shock CspA family protein